MIPTNVITPHAVTAEEPVPSAFLASVDVASRSACSCAADFCIAPRSRSDEECGEGTDGKACLIGVDDGDLNVGRIGPARVACGNLLRVNDGRTQLHGKCTA
jgi:hypothetical protein